MANSFLRSHSHLSARPAFSEQLADPNVSFKRCTGYVTRLSLDLPDRDSRERCRSDETRPERVARIPIACPTDRVRALLYDQRNSISRKPARENFSSLGDRAEDRPFGDVREIDPVLECADRADRIARDRDRDLSSVSLLVSLALANGDDQAGLTVLNRFTIECDEFRPAERAGEPYEQERPVAHILNGIAQRGHDRNQMLGGKSRGPLLRTATCPSNASERSPNEIVERWIGETRSDVGAPYGGEAPSKGRRREDAGVIRDILGDLLRACRNTAAPSEEMRKVTGVGASGVRGDRRDDKLLDFRIEVGDISEPLGRTFRVSRGMLG